MYNVSFILVTSFMSEGFTLERIVDRMDENDDTDNTKKTRVKNYSVRKEVE